MESDKSTIERCHRLLQDILRDAFNIQAILFIPPYGDFKQIDQGMRAAVWTDYDLEDGSRFFAKDYPQHRIIIVRSNLGFYNIIITLSKGFQPEFITVGPFRDNELSANYFAQILKESQINPSEIQRTKYMYERMPLAQVDAVVNVTKHVLEAFLPDFHEIIPEFMHFSEQKKAVVINTDLLNAYSADYSAKYRELLFEFLGHIANGNNPKAKEALYAFLNETSLVNHRNMSEYKSVMLRINEYCHLTLLNTSIHPLHILKQTSSINIKIKEETSLARLEKMPSEICHKYCLLVKNYANPECSRLTKDVIAYIQLHLDEDLTLSLLASHYHKNASALSNTFSKDMGMSLTTYIQQTRIQAALKLFNTTDMSVSEVATAVGYQDFSYFSRLFTRYVGHSPRAYLAKRS